MVALVSTLSPVATVVIAKKLEKLLPVLLVPIFVIVEDSVVDVLISALVGVTLPAIKSGRPGVGVLKIVHNGGLLASFAHVPSGRTVQSGGFVAPFTHELSVLVVQSGGFVAPFIHVPLAEVVHAGGLFAPLTQMLPADTVHSGGFVAKFIQAPLFVVHAGGLLAPFEH